MATLYLAALSAVPLVLLSLCAMIAVIVALSCAGDRRTVVAMQIATAVLRTIERLVRRGDRGDR